MNPLTVLLKPDDGTGAEIVAATEAVLVVVEPDDSRSQTLSAAMLLRHHQGHYWACKIEPATTSLVANPGARTRGIGRLGTAAFTEQVCIHIREAQA
ncbi:MAG: hypothetical protein AAF499_19155 [Pseudomonadota bacterium]